MTDQRGARPPRDRRLAERLLGSAAEESAPRPARRAMAAPVAVRRAALVAAIEAAALAVLALWLLLLTFTAAPDSLSRAVATVVLVGLFAGVLGAAAVGLWRLSPWARAPVVAVQLFAGLLGLVATFQAGQPLIGVPVLVLVATELYLLATPEARLAFIER